MTGWFTRVPVTTHQENQSLGIAIMVAVMTLAVGAGIRRMELIELRSALLGAASVLLALALSEAAITQKWNIATTIVSGLGLIALLAGGSCRPEHLHSKSRTRAWLTICIPFPSCRNRRRPIPITASP